MKIGIMPGNSRFGSGGGMDVYTRQLVDALADYAPFHQYSVLAFADTLSDWTFRNWPRHVAFVTLYRDGRSLSSKAWSYTKRLFDPAAAILEGEQHIRQQIDGLHLNLIHFTSTYISPLSVRTPCVLTFFDMQHEYYPEFFTPSELTGRTRLFQPSVDKAQHVIVPSYYTRQTLIEKYATPAAKMSLVPVGLAEDYLRAGNSEVKRIKHKYELPNDFIFYPANPWQHKNHARLMAALRLCRDHYGIRPQLVLSGRLLEEHREARSLAIAAGVEGQVMDLGFVPPGDLAALYTAARFMVFPSLFEGFGIPLVEAMACGCPIAAANSTSIPECTGDAALLFDPWQPQAIAEAIARLWSDLNLREELARAGIARADQYRWPKIVPALNAVYEQATDSKYLREY